MKKKIILALLFFFISCSKKESVKSINVNLEEMLITINLKKGKILNDDIIKQVIRDSGYDIKEINREK